MGLNYKKMNNINFTDGKWWELSLGFAYPHQWFKLGWELFEPEKQNPSFLVNIYLFCMVLSIEWGDEDWEL